MCVLANSLWLRSSHGKFSDRKSSITPAKSLCPNGWKETKTVASRSVLYRYVNSVTFLGQILAYISRKAPGVSGMVTISVRSESSARSETTRKRLKSMLAPEVMATKVDPDTSFSSTYFFNPATARAPAGSRMTRLAVRMAKQTTSATRKGSIQHQIWYRHVELRSPIPLPPTTNTHASL
jgi:hypothetical protein